MNERMMSRAEMMKRASALLLALAMLFVLAACGKGDDGGSGRRSKKASEKAVCEIAKVTQSYTVKYDGGDEVKQSVETYFNELGLVFAMTAVTDEEVHTVEFTYGFDDHDMLNHVSGEVEDRTLELTIENTYDKNRLTEAVISDIILDGESFREEGYLDSDGVSRLSAVNSSIFQTVKTLINHYVGYQNCSLRFGDTGMTTRYEDGKIVYDYALSYEVATETINEFSRGEISSTVNSYRYENGQYILLNGTNTVYDDGNQIVRMGMTLPGVDLPLEFDFRFEDRTNAETEERVRLAYIDEDSVRHFLADHSDSIGAFSESDIEDLLDMAKDYPLYRYTLDRRGRIVKAESLLSGLTSSYEQTNVTFYDGQGRAIRQEYGFDTGSYCYLSVTETEYR